MSFSEIIKDSFVLIAKELAKLGSGKVEFKSQRTKEVSIDDKYGANCAIISIEDKTQFAITESGDAFLRVFKAETWDPWSRIIRDNDPILSMLHADNPDSIDPKLTIKGNVRIKNLKGKNLIEKQNPEDLTPVVLDKDGNLISLPYKRGETEDHFIIPILRSGCKSFKKGEELRIENLFNPGKKYPSGKKHLIEIRLLIDLPSKLMDGIIYYINDKLYVTQLGGIKQPDDKTSKLINFENEKFTLQILENVHNKHEHDILIKYSGGDNITIKYFITRYATD